MFQLEVGMAVRLDHFVGLVEVGFALLLFGGVVLLGVVRLPSPTRPAANANRIRIICI